jgi:hypothetical protein
MTAVQAAILRAPAFATLRRRGPLTSSGSEPVVTGLVTLGLLVAVGGIFLIRAAIRGPRA